MHFRKPLAIAAIATTLVACASLPTSVRPAATTPRPVAPEVVLISIDGYRADYFERGLNPVLQHLGDEGVRAQWMIPSFPTVTEPNHYTFLTGLYPDHNGIVANDIEDRDIQRQRFRMSRFDSTENPRWWSEATPLWLSAERDGMRTAEVSWPDGEVSLDGAQVNLHFNGHRVASPREETDTVIRWLALPPDQRPRLILVHYEPVDREGHHYGPDSPQVNAAIRDVDSAIGKLVAALKRDDLYADTDLVVVSDHGMAAIPPGHVIYLDDIIDMHSISLISGDALAGIDPHRDRAGARAAAALLTLPHPHMQCWRKQDIPARLHYGQNPRVPAIDCLADPGWIITTRAEAARRPYPLRGTHGYDNAAPSMRAIFIAEGPSFRRGVVVPPFPNVDVYPLLAHILGIAPERNDGDFNQVAPLLKPA